MTAIATGDRRPTAVAKVVTELSSPTVLAPALLVAVALDQWPARGVAALGWGLLAAFFAGALPLAFLKVGVRRGRWTDHHVDQREARIVPLGFALGSVVVGTVLLAVLGAPRDLVALVVAMGAGLGAVLAVSHWWKISIHSAVAGGTAVVLGSQFGPAGAAAGALMAGCAAWSRSALGKHTTTQIIAGLALGLAIALALYPALR